MAGPAVERSLCKQDPISRSQRPARRRDNNGSNLWNVRDFKILVVRTIILAVRTSKYLFLYNIKEISTSSG